jgi:hypothetical protein
VKYKDQILTETNNRMFLGLQLDNHLTWKIRINQLLHKLSTACFVVRRLFHVLNTDDALRITYFAYFHSKIFLVKFN